MRLPKEMRPGSCASVVQIERVRIDGAKIVKNFPASIGTVYLEPFLFEITHSRHG